MGQVPEEDNDRQAKNTELGPERTDRLVSMIRRLGRPARHLI